MGAVLDLAERAWRGEVEGLNVSLEGTLVALEPLEGGLAFMSAFSNALAVDTEEGLLLIDTSSFFHAWQLHEQVRAWTKRPLHTAVYTHGHVDHVFGLGPFEAEAGESGTSRLRVIAHAACPARFDRYRRTAGYNGWINARQFGFAKAWPTEYRYPDVLVQDRMEFSLGGEEIVLEHDRGETDDHLWAWLPARRALYTGDLFIWASPNCGNPQKVQRYPQDWAAALRKMAAREARWLFPGHGPPILGEERVRQALEETASLLESLLEQTLALMNDGATLDDVLHAVRAPAALLERPYLRPVYDEPEFIVRNVWRLYGGWYDLDPSHLKPAPASRLATAIADLSGGPARLAAAAERQAADGDLRLACHLVELAVQAAPDDRALHAARARIYSARVATETSLMAKGIFRAAARQSEERGGALDP